ncbi:MAG TPA: SRPBCC domain-containing protein [Thermoplasmata archaeon]|nr:SRPBCC domain-containing protein [Thermoplasmata archaeon]
MAKKAGTRTAARTSKQPELAITRILHAPVGRVWKAWTVPEEMKKWWGPKEFTTPFCTIDLRVGGLFRYCMRAPDGKEFWGRGIYNEIIPNRRLVVTDSFTDETGKVVPATHYGMSSETPLEMLVTVTFEEVPGGTKLTLRHVGIPAGPDSEGANTGWSQSFDKLAELVEE